MIAFQKNKKNFLLTENGIKRIKEDIKDLSKLPLGITIQSKEFDFAYYIKIIISKNNINIDTSNKKFELLPDSIAFLIVLDNTYPEEPPKIFCQTNVSIIILYTLKKLLYIVLISEFNGWKKSISKYNIKMGSANRINRCNKNNSSFYQKSFNSKSI